MSQHATLTAGTRPRRRGDLLRYLVAWPVVLLLVGAGLHVMSAPPASAADECTGSTIGNGTVSLGVNCLGSLGLPTGTEVGLRYAPTGAEAVTGGEIFEGWGVADLTSGVTGYVNSSTNLPSPPTSPNVSLHSYTSTPQTARSVVDVGSTFRVTQDFHPSDQTPDLYEVDVTVANVSGADTHLRYRRVMDWDIDPTPFREYVTLQQGTSPRVEYTSDDGFASSDPLAGETKIRAEGSFVDSGPTDHGALFDFDFGTIGAGASRSFKIFYGAAASEDAAADALNSVNAEAYSFGQPGPDEFDDHSDQGPQSGKPNTFVFAFKDIDGASVFAPFAVTDNVVAYTAVPKVIDVLRNDSDPNGDPLTIVTDKTTTPTHGTVTCTTARCTYTSAEGYTGPDSFRYYVSDGNGGEGTAQVFIDVTPPPTNKPPVAHADTLVTDEDVPGTVDVLRNDTDEDEDDHLTVSGSTNGSRGRSTCTTAGICTYTPYENSNGADTFTYTVTDGKDSVTGTVNVTIRPVNDAPVAVADPMMTTDEDTPVTADLAGNDTDVDGDDLSATAFSQPAHGEVDCSGKFCTYTPDADWNGIDSFEYRAFDGAYDASAYSQPMRVYVRVDPVNDAPVAVDDVVTMNQDDQAEISVLDNDKDVDGDAITVSGSTQPDHGEVTCDQETCVYTPTPGWYGSDAFTYTITDGQVGATATVRITVKKVNKAPVAVADEASTDEDTAVDIPVTGNDTDADDPRENLVAVLDGEAEHGTVICSGGTCRYTPDQDWNGTDTFSYRASDGELQSEPVTVTVTVAAVNDDPVAVDDSGDAVAGGSVTVEVTANDYDVDGDELTVQTRGNAGHGTVECDDTSCTYSPEASFEGTDSFTYAISDGHGGSDSATVTIAVAQPNRTPVTKVDNISLDEDTTATFHPLANDSDPDGDTLSLTLDPLPSGFRGTVTCDGGTCTYTPPTNWFGTTSFTYTASDGNGHSAIGTVNLTVRPVNDAPVPGRDTLVTDRDKAGTVDVLANDDDVDGDVLTATVRTQSTKGTATCKATGVCTFTPKLHWAGDTTFEYTVSDGKGGTAVGTVDVTVRAVNAVPDAPVIGTASNTVKKVGSKRYNAAITWKAGWNGGTAITSYKVFANRLSGSKVVKVYKYSVSGSATSLRLVLPKGTYSFQVVAYNALGKSVKSAVSKKVATK